MGAVLALALVGFILLISACRRDTVSALEPASDPRIAELQALYATRLAEAETLRDSETGWLVADRDGMRWTGLYAASKGVRGVQLSPAEFQPKEGRFCRFPGQVCFDDPETTWSRDQGVGLLWWGWRTKDRDAIDRHAHYGRAHNWQMGEPLGDGRVVYSPAMIGMTNQVLFALGGEDHLDRHWPNVYPAGLYDYQAALQVLDILLRDQIQSPAPRSLVLMPTSSYGYVTRLVTPQLLIDISIEMYARLREHRDRMPKAPLYQYGAGLFAGDLSQAVATCLESQDDGSVDYLRCDKLRNCWLADWLFACSLTLEAYGS